MDRKFLMEKKSGTSRKNYHKEDVPTRVFVRFLSIIKQLQAQDLLRFRRNERIA